MPGFARTIYSEDSEHPRRLVSDSIYAPDPQRDVLPGDYTGPLFLVLKDLDSKEENQ